MKSNNSDIEINDLKILNNSQIDNEENKKIKKVKSNIDNYITISDNVLQFLPEDISKDEIKKMVYDALGNSIVKYNQNYIKGNNFTNEQINCIIDILYNKVTKQNNIEEKYDEMFKDIKINIEFRDINKQNIRKILFKDENPTKEEIEEILNHYLSGTDKPKFFVVELS